MAGRSFTVLSSVITANGELEHDGTAVVLGAGGPVGHGFHAGVLAALAEERGFDARAAELIVGTSAGAGVGALLRAHVSGPELLDRVCGRQLTGRAHAAARCFRRPTHASRSPRRTWRPANASYVWHVVRRPWSARFGCLVAALLPPGRVLAHDYAAGISELFASGWPRTGLWIPAVRLRDGAVVAFGKDDGPTVDVGTAIAASSAVPGLWAPVVVHGEAYVDGGVASALHSGLAAHSPTIKRVVVSSPLSRMPLMTTLLRAEVGRLRRQGLEVITFEPGPGTVKAMGWNPMDVARAPSVALAAYEEARARLRSRPAALSAGEHHS